MGIIIYTEIGLKIRVIITIKVLFDGMCCNLNEGLRGGRLSVR